MVAFIGAEAREKELEIDQQALEEHDIEKQRLVEKGKKKMLAEFESKLASLEIDKRVSRSNCLMRCQHELVKERHDLIDSIRTQLHARCLAMKSDAKLYRRNLKHFIEEAAKAVCYDAIIICLQEDLAVVQELATELQQKFVDNQVFSNKSTNPMKLHVCTDDHLDEDSLGGVILKAQDGKIVCDNTLRHRAEICIADKLPEIRTMLFA
ncbi:ATP synthase [Perkinsela sp. CCAP 1560/4]|nr:ATP synthase [Perkinsela sp. CCAP 1560/4]KNH09171.1 ATP synthase [Perkinsela sp. CCAP 1560/4]|eukprot:KNH08184.1 ATP synthase [Perkinsela sp. CCAP 1560/4]